VSQRTKILVAVIATVALVGGYWHFSLEPQRKQAAALAEQVAAKEQTVATAQGVLTGYRKAQAAYPANYATLVRLGKAVPQDDDTRSLLVQLDAAARRSGVDFRTLEVSEQASGADAAAAATATPSSSTTAGSGDTPPGAVPVGSAGFSALPFTFTFRGRFADLSRFFSHLQRFVTAGNERMTVTGRLLRLDSVTLKPDATGFPRIRADVTASSFLLPATEGLTAGGTPSGPAAAGSATGTTDPSATTTATVTGATIR
jgi:hypothetical protein